LTGYSVGTLLAAITRGVIGLILIAADATEREHRKW
jgi:ribosomal protein L7Ae-like RNA K-turn-binding protein